MKFLLELFWESVISKIICLFRGHDWEKMCTSKVLFRECQRCSKIEIARYNFDGI